MPNHPYRETFDQMDTRIAREMREAHEDETPSVQVQKREPMSEMTFTDYRLPDGSIVACDASATKNAAEIGFTLKGGTVVRAVRVSPAPKMVTHRFNVWIDVPAVSGDGWSKYPDYSGEEIARAIRRALHDGLEYKADVEFSDTTPLAQGRHCRIDETGARSGSACRRGHCEKRGGIDMTTEQLDTLTAIAVIEHFQQTDAILDPDEMEPWLTMHHAVGHLRDSLPDFDAPQGTDPVDTSNHGDDYGERRGLAS
jgi:hypothetical protein